MTDKKKVSFVIEVPVGPYCWMYTLDGSTPCQYFDNANVPKCELGFRSHLVDDFIGYQKPVKCLGLEGVSDD